MEDLEWYGETAAEAVERQERDNPSCDECEGHIGLDCTCPDGDA